MLDLEHPQTKHIFQAAKLEDQMRPILVAARSDERTFTDTERSQLDVLLGALDDLNAANFGQDAGIVATIEYLRQSIHAGESSLAWTRFIDLAERPGKNFGTWAI